MTLFGCDLPCEIKLIHEYNRLGFLSLVCLELTSRLKQVKTQVLLGFPIYVVKIETNKNKRDREFIFKKSMMEYMPPQPRN